MMRTRIGRFGITAIAGLFACLPLIVRAGAAKGPAWQSLFNGHNLDGWEVVNGGAWTVENGDIVARRLPNDTRGGWLVTRKDFGDFIVRLKFRPGADAFNSGVLIRDPGHAMVSRPAFHGFEIQLQQGEPDPNTNGAIYDVARAYPKIIDAKNWSTIEVRCAGDHIETFVNGAKMAETHTRRSFSGAIGLQMHGGKDPLEYRFRDIEVQEFPARRPESLMLEERFERDATEFKRLWTTEPLNDVFVPAGGDSHAWTLENGILRGTGSTGWSGVVTRSAYSDYLLMFDARVPKSSEAVVSLRRPDSTRGFDSATGFESSIGYQCAIAEVPENPSGSILGLAPGMVTSDWMTPIHRPGRWNNVRVYVQGDHVVTYVNLSKTADVHAPRAPSGHIGFYVKSGSTVEFQNVQIKVIR